jgi:hypothetical protein
MTPVQLFGQSGGQTLGPGHRGDAYATTFEIG